MAAVESIRLRGAEAGIGGDGIHMPIVGLQCPDTGAPAADDRVARISYTIATKRSLEFIGVVVRGVIGHLAPIE